MTAKGTAGGDASPLFLLATRLFVHYKFKTRNTFDASAAMIDDDYARQVLAQVRAVHDATLQDLADKFEADRFPTKGKAKTKPAAKPRDGDEMSGEPAENPA